MRTLLALVALLLLPAAAYAAPPWSPPQSVSAPHTFISDPALAFSGNGSALAVWRWQDNIRQDARAGEAASGRRPGAAAFDLERDLSPAGRVGHPVLYGSARAVLAIVRPVGSVRDPDSQLRVAFGRPDGELGTSRLIARRPRIARPVLAGNARGDLALAWFEDRGTANDRVYVSLRPAGGAFGRPILLATGRIRSVSTAVGGRGDVLVAWDARGIVRARLRRPGRSFGPTETIRSRDAFFAELETAVAPSGRAYVAWGAQLLTEGGGTGAVTFQAAVRPAGRSRFREAQLIDELPAARSQNGVDLVLRPDGGATFAWTGVEGTANRVRASETGPDARFGAPAAVSPAASDAVLTNLAAGPDGSRATVWTVSLPGERREVHAALAPPGGPFGPDETISTGEQSDTARIAFDPRSGAPTAVWVARPAGSLGPIDSIRTYLQAATRG